jgi:rhodanese-related sulfurtransferase
LSIGTVTPLELLRRREEGHPIHLIDVRTPIEFHEAHVDGAHNVPLDQLDPSTLVRGRNASDVEPLYVICRSGNRSQKASERLVEAGLTNIINVEGGTVACEAARLPMVRGKDGISVERQVRIVLGALVLTSSLLACFVSPWCILMVVFMGAGLIFSGAAGWCGTSMILARMPWNERCPDAASRGVL